MNTRNSDRVLHAEIVKSGTWLYDQRVPSEVWIVRQNFEYHYEYGYEDEPERLNENGESFAVIIARNGYKIGRGSEEMSFCEVVVSAESLITGIYWDNHVLGKLYGGRQHCLVL